MTKIVTPIFVSLCLAFGLNSNAYAEYPERPITMIIAYSAGGSTDVGARTFVPFIEKYLGTTITVMNKPGAGGEVGWTELAAVKPDGYTIGYINIPTVLTIPIERKTRFNLSNFIPIARIEDDSSALSVKTDSEFKNLEDIVAYARENPGKLSYGSSGIGSDDHLAVLSFARQAGIELRHVPFNGSAPARAAVLGGHVALLSANISEQVLLAEAEQVRVLGQMAPERGKIGPDVPTFKEQGYDVVSGAQRGIAAPAGTDPQIVEKLGKAIRQAFDDPEFQEKAKKQGLALNFADAAEFVKTLNAKNEDFKAIWQKTPWSKKKK